MPLAIVSAALPCVTPRRCEGCKAPPIMRRHAGTRCSNPRARSGRINALNSDAKSPTAVVILPGFLQGAATYRGMAAHLASLGHATAVVPISSAQWLPTLAGGSFSWYLDAAARCVAESFESQGAASQQGHVALVGHSAGGWLARLLLGSRVYDGKTYGLAPRVHTLLTLGAPHLSLEAYPFGRVAEKRRVRSAGALLSYSHTVHCSCSKAFDSCDFLILCYPCSCRLQHSAFTSERHGTIAFRR